MKMSYNKWRQIGSICGYDGTKRASVWSADADRLRKACPYDLWIKIAAWSADRGDDWWKDEGSELPGDKWERENKKKDPEGPVHQETIKFDRKKLESMSDEEKRKYIQEKIQESIKRSMEKALKHHMEHNLNFMGIPFSLTENDNGDGTTTISGIIETANGEIIEKLKATMMQWANKRGEPVGKVESSGSEVWVKIKNNDRGTSMAKMTLDKWKKIGRICGYDGTRTASVWSKEADKLRKACSYKMWKKIAQVSGWKDLQENSEFKFKNISGREIPGTAFRFSGGWVVKVEGVSQDERSIYRVNNPQVLFDYLEQNGENMSSFNIEVSCAIDGEDSCQVERIIGPANN